MGQETSTPMIPRTPTSSSSTISSIEKRPISSITTNVRDSYYNARSWSRLTFVCSRHWHLHRRYQPVCQHGIMGQIQEVVVPNCRSGHRHHFRPTCYCRLPLRHAILRHGGQNLHVRLLPRSLHSPLPRSNDRNSGDPIQG